MKSCIRQELEKFHFQELISSILKSIHRDLYKRRGIAGMQLSRNFENFDGIKFKNKNMWIYRTNKSDPVLTFDISFHYLLPGLS